MNPSPAAVTVGTQLRHWRRLRRLSQLDLSVDAAISTRHLSCLETGRAMPSRDMVLRLANHLEVPLRERNRLLTAAGFAPMFAERPLDDPALDAAHEAVRTVLRAHEPCPALALDRHWQVVFHNEAAGTLLRAGVAAALLEPPVNVLRVALHPDGLAPRILNLAAWRGHLLERLRQQAARSADPALARLLQELAGYPAPSPAGAPPSAPATDIVVPLVLRTERGILSLISTTTVFGTPLEVTLSELALETFFPADADTGRLLREAAEARRVPATGA